MASSIGVQEKKLPEIAAGISQVTVLSAEHQLKQPSPILVTEDGMLMDVREAQPLKQKSPKLVTDDGMSMDVSAKQPSKQ